MTMDILRPVTTIVEWIWCAAQVGATYVELCLFVSTLAVMAMVGWHIYRWNAIQSQLETNAEDIRALAAEARRTPDCDPANKEATDKEIAKLVDELRSLCNETGVVKKHLIDILSLMRTLKPISLEIANFHKLLGTVVSDCGKLGGFYNRVTETHGLVIKIPSQQQHEGNLLKLQKDLEEYVDKMQKALASKLEELSEKTAVLRVVMD